MPPPFVSSISTNLSGCALAQKPCNQLLLNNSAAHSKSRKPTRSGPDQTDQSHFSIHNGILHWLWVMLCRFKMIIKTAFETEIDIENKLVVTGLGVQYKGGGVRGTSYWVQE